MEQRIIDLEKKVQELEAALNETKGTTVQALALISAQMEQQLNKIIEEYRNGYMEAALKVMNEKIKSNN